MQTKTRVFNSSSCIIDLLKYDSTWRACIRQNYTSIQFLELSFWLTDQNSHLRFTDSAKVFIKVCISFGLNLFVDPFIKVYILFGYPFIKVSCSIARTEVCIKWQIGNRKIITITRAIITRSLYTFYPLFEVHLFMYCDIWPYVWLVFKSVF